MRVFVAGATGAIGRPLVQRLSEAGHEVTGMTRSPEKADALRAAGATPAVCDALDGEAVLAVVTAAAPEVIVQQLTELPREYNPRALRASYAQTDRLRRAGTDNLIEAGRAAGTRRVIAQSVAFAYAPRGGRVKEEDDRLFTEAPGMFGETVRGLVEMDRTVTQTSGIEGVVLRYGQFYGPGTYFAPGGSIAEQVRKRRFPVVGTGEGMFSFIHIDDAAAATLAALDRGAGIYNIVDDDPAPLREWLPLYAQAIGARPPRRVPLWLAKLVAGRGMAAMAAGLRGASNAKAKRELGWQPRYASWRDGFLELGND